MHELMSVPNRLVDYLRLVREQSCSKKFTKWSRFSWKKEKTVETALAASHLSWRCSFPWKCPVVSCDILHSASSPDALRSAFSNSQATNCKVHFILTQQTVRCTVTQHTAKYIVTWHFMRRATAKCTFLRHTGSAFSVDTLVIVCKASKSVSGSEMEWNRYDLFFHPLLSQTIFPLMCPCIL